MSRVYVIAEIGINHNGSLSLAKELIHAAKEAGADAVKFQKRTINKVYTFEELSKPRESKFGTTNGDLKRGLELSEDNYWSIRAYCDNFRIDWSASVWDIDSVDFLMQFNPPWIKIPSALITNLDLLDKVRDTRKPVILSTGMSTEVEITGAVEMLRLHDVMGGKLEPLNITILHCTSTYPCPFEELNLSDIRRLYKLFNKWALPGGFACKIGFSSHSVSPWPCLMAVAIGSEMVEAHLTMDRTMWGSDQKASLEPKAFAKMVEEIRTYEIAYGGGPKRVYDSEVPIREKLRR